MVELSATNFSLLRKRFFRELGSFSARLQHFGLIWTKGLLNAIDIVFVDLSNGSGEIQCIRYGVVAAFTANCARI